MTPRLVGLVVLLVALPSSAAPTKPPASQPAAPRPDGIQLRFVPGRGIEARRNDGEYRLEIGVRGQFLYGVEVDDDDAEQSLQLRRIRLRLSGNAFGAHNKFKIELAVSPRDVGLQEGRIVNTPLLDWFAVFDYLRDVTVRLGQYKVPYSRQRVVSSAALQLVERSIVNAEFNLDRDVGLDLRSDDLFGVGLMRYRLGVYFGEGRDPLSQGDFGLLYIARFEVLPLGMFKDYSEADLARGRLRIALGVGYGYLDQGKRNRGIIGQPHTDGGTVDTHNFTVDLAARFRGFSLELAWMWRSGTREPGDAVDENGAPLPVELPRDGHGGHAQLGYVLPRVPVELALRGAYIEPFGESSLAATRSAGGGLSFYPGGHPLKVQLDYFYLWDKGKLDQGRYRLRLQLQLAL